MSAPVSNQATAAGPEKTLTAPVVAEIDLSCRLPLLVLFLSGAIWLVIASAFGLIGSLKFHAPNLLADTAWLTYGRVHAVCTNALVYGFCVQAGLGVTLWLLARLGRTVLAQPWLAILGGAIWNLGVTIGVLEILAGNSTGFDYFEMPGHAALLVFVGYLVMGISGVLTFHQRRERQLFPSQWFIFTAFFWFPWIYSTANLLLLTFPARGVDQAVIAWWYANNLLVVWLGLMGLATAFYFVPKLSNRDLHSHYLALFTFWMLILFASWGGIPNSAPVPAWLPTISTVATVLLIIPILAVALNIYSTTGRIALLAKANPVLSFVLVGIAAFILAGLMQICSAVVDTDQMLHFTWFDPAKTQLHVFGFFALVTFGAVYFIVPQLTGIAFRFPGLIRAHFWTAAVGILLYAAPLAIGGVIQALQMQDATIPFIKVSQTSLHFLRVSTLGDLLLLCANLLFTANLFGMVVHFSRVRAAAAYSTVTADLFKTAEAKL